MRIGDTFPQIMVKPRDVKGLSKARRLKRDLKSLSGEILKYSPAGFDRKKLSRLRIRIFRFSKNEGCNEFFVVAKNRKYVCLNSAMLEWRYYTALQHVLHGIAHSFCRLRTPIAEECFCEFVGYSAMSELIKDRKDYRRIVGSVMRNSPKEYNIYFRATKKLEKREAGRIVKLNRKAKYKGISKKAERRIFYKIVKIRSFPEEEGEIPELERGFRKV